MQVFLFLPLKITLFYALIPVYTQRKTDIFWLWKCWSCKWWLFASVASFGFLRWRNSAKTQWMFGAPLPQPPPLFPSIRWTHPTQQIIAARAPWAQLPNLPVWQEKSRCESAVTWWIYAQVANGKSSTACSLLLQNWRTRTIVWVAMLSKIIRSVWLHFCAGSWEWKFLYRLGKILFAVWIYWFQMDYTHMKLVNLLLEHN